MLLVQLLVDGVVLGAMYALLALSISLIYATTATFHFAHGSTFTIAAYVAVLTAAVGVPWPLAMVLAVVAGGLLGAFWEIVAYRPMRRAGATGLSIFIVSLGITIVVPGLIQIVFGPQNRSLPVPSPSVTTIAPESGGGVSFSNFDVATVLVCAILIVLVLILRSATKYGLAATAVQNNATMASAVGILPTRIFTLVFVVGSALMAVAAMIFLLQGTANANIGTQFSLFAFIGMFLGGVGSHGRAVLGGLALGLFVSVSGLWWPQDIASIAVYVLLFVALIVRPRGLFAGREKKGK